LAECTVARLLDRGMVVNLSADVEGFIPLNQLGQSADHPSRIYKVEDKVPAKVIEFDLEGRKIVLSVSEFFKDKGEELWKDYCDKHPVTQKKPKEKKEKHATADENAPAGDAAPAPDAAPEAAPAAPAEESKE
jgi:small subunit ribosomal protein S1